MTCFTYSTQHHALVQNDEIFLILFRYFNLIKNIIFKIDYFPALDAMEMMMVIQIGVKTLYTTVGLDDLDNSQFGKSG